MGEGHGLEGQRFFHFSVDEKACVSKVALWPIDDAHHQALTIWKNCWTIPYRSRSQHRPNETSARIPAIANWFTLWSQILYYNQ